MAVKNWSSTAADNVSGLTGINWNEGMNAAAVNDSARGTLAQIADWYAQIKGGTIYPASIGGTANAITLTCSPTIDAYATGQRFLFKASSTNTGSTTINVDGLGAKTVQFAGENLNGGEITSGDLVTVSYDGTYLQLLSTPRAVKQTKVYVSNYATLGAADTAAVAIGAAIALDADVSLTGDTTVASRVIGEGGIITRSTHALTFSNYFSAPPIQCFDADGSGALTFSKKQVAHLAWFGPATGSGSNTTNDTVFAAAVASGADIYVDPITDPASDYYETKAQIGLTANGQRIFGAGWLSAIKNVGASYQSVIALSGVTGGEVYDLHIIANGTINSQTQGCGVVLTSSSTRCKVYRNTFENVRSSAVIVISCNYNEIFGNSVINSPVDDSDDNTTCSTDIYMYGGCVGNNVHDNYINSGNGFGVGVDSISSGDAAADNSIHDNFITNARGYGVFSYVTDGSVSRTRIENNTVLNISGSIEAVVTTNFPFGAGIYVQGSEDCSVVGNKVYNTHSGAAVTFADTLAPAAIGSTNCSRINIVGNTIDTDAMNGISVRDPNGSGSSTGYANVSGNTIRNIATSTQGYGIEVKQRGRVNITGNAIDTALYGIFVDNSSAQKYFSVTGNSVRNITHAIYCNYATDIAITGNTIASNANNGVYVNNVTNCAITGNVVDGISAPVGSRGINVTNTGCSNITVNGNNCYNNEYGYLINSACRFGRSNFGASNTVLYGGSFATVRTLTANSTTPSVQDGETFITANSVSTSISNFTNGYDGQQICVIVNDANTTFDFTSSNLKGNSGVDYAAASGACLYATYRSSNWYCTLGKPS